MEAGVRALCVAAVLAALVCSGCHKTIMVPDIREVPETRYRAVTKYRDVLAPGKGELDAERYRRLAVYPFRADGYDDVKTRYCADAVENWLVHQGVFDVVSRQRLDTVLQEQNIGQGERLNPQTIARLRQVLGVEAVIVGTLYRSETDVTWSLQILDSETAEVVWGADGQGHFEDCFPELLEPIVEHQVTVTEAYESQEPYQVLVKKEVGSKPKRVRNKEADIALGILGGIGIAVLTVFAIRAIN